MTVIAFKPRKASKPQPPKAKREPQVFFEPIAWAIRREAHDYMCVFPILRETRTMIYLGYYRRLYGDQSWTYRKHYRFEVLARFETEEEAEAQVAQFHVTVASFTPAAIELRKQMDAHLEQRRIAVNAAAKEIKDRWGVSP